MCLLQLPREMPERLDRNIPYDRLSTPTDQLGVLIAPDSDRLARLIGGDYSTSLAAVRLLDTTIGELRRQLRARLDLSGPIILTGHQLEFAHAGVFAKSIAVETLARRCAAAGVFLAVDSDLPKQINLLLPSVEGELVRRVAVTIPACDPTLSIESQPQLSKSQWHTFFSKLAAYADDNSLLSCFAAASKHTSKADLATIIESGQAAVSRQLGLADLHSFRVSWLSQTPEFRAFAAHLILHARDFARHYNQAQREFRIRYRVRNPQRPAPPLLCDDDRTELPFWIGRSGQPRQRLFVGDRGDRIELFSDRQLLGDMAKTQLRRFDSHRQSWPVERDGWRLRPRALTLSAFVRLFVSDLFIHGIGGAKYDEMTADFTRSFFKTELPPAGCVSATVQLSLPCHGIDRQTLSRHWRRRRDLRFNPQRHFDNLPPDLLARRADLLITSNRLRTTVPTGDTRRRRVFDEIRAINNDLLAFGGDQVELLEYESRRLARLYQSDRAASDREYFFALHSRETLAKLVQNIRASLE